ncbi:MAG TPA: hypothetical protein PK431_06010 [Chitinophagales bacterium]|nr:hypothetical protein [Chitinophagales bacterium]
MKSTLNKKKSGTFSFQVKVFSIMLFVFIVCSIGACKKDSISLTPTPPDVAENKDKVPDQPNIKHTDLHQLVAIGAADGTQETKIDINSDGTFDVSAQIYRSAGSLNLYFVSNTGNKVSTGLNYLVRGYGAETLISLSTQNWEGYGDICRVGFASQNVPVLTTTITPDVDSYLGVKIMKDNKDYYAWIRFRFTVYTGATNAAIIEIKDCAYEKTQGFGIKTGNTF